MESQVLNDIYICVRASISTLLMSCRIPYRTRAPCNTRLIEFDINSIYFISLCSMSFICLHPLIYSPFLIIQSLDHLILWSFIQIERSIFSLFISWRKKFTFIYLFFYILIAFHPLFRKSFGLNFVRESATYVSYFSFFRMIQIQITCVGLRAGISYHFDITQCKMFMIWFFKHGWKNEWQMREKKKCYTLTHIRSKWNTVRWGQTIRLGVTERATNHVKCHWEGECSSLISEIRSVTTVLFLFFLVATRLSIFYFKLSDLFIATLVGRQMFSLKMDTVELMAHMNYELFNEKSHKMHITKDLCISQQCWLFWGFLFFIYCPF